MVLVISADCLLSAKLECAHAQAEGFLFAQGLCGPGAAQSHPENHRKLLKQKHTQYNTPGGPLHALSLQLAPLVPDLLPGPVHQPPLPGDRLLLPPSHLLHLPPPLPHLGLQHSPHLSLHPLHLLRVLRLLVLYGGQWILVL